MNAFLLATMVFSAAASEAALRETAEFFQIQHTVDDIAERISNIKLKESDFNFGEFDWISFDEDKADTPSVLLEKRNIDEDIFEPFDPSTEDRIVERLPGLKPNPPPASHLHKKRSCKTFEDTKFAINAKDKLAKTLGYTWESCLKSCEDNLLCAQVIFDKEKKECLGYRMANSKTAAGVAPQNFMSGHCKTEAEESLGVNFLRKAADSESGVTVEDGVVEDTSFLQTGDKSEVKVDAAAAEFEEQMKMEEQLAMLENDIKMAKEDGWKVPTPQEASLENDLKMAKEDGWKVPTPQEAARFWDQKKDKMAAFDPYKMAKKPSLKLRQKITKKCTTFETENLTKKGSLLQVGKKLLTSETTGDFLTCLQKCQKDATCKQVVYDKQASQCYKHDDVIAQKSNAKGTKYIAATCQ